MMPGLPHSLVVNRAGKRFGDEAFFHSYVAAMYTFDGSRQQFPNWPAWLVFDEDFREKYPIGPIAGAPLPPGMAMTADSLEELAKLIGVEGDGLVATVDRFNSFCETGVDEDFGRGRPWSRTCLGDPAMTPNPNLGPVAEAPFYAITLGRVGTGLASAGLHTTPTAQVVDVDGSPIPGLYAVGNLGRAHRVRRGVQQRHGRRTQSRASATAGAAPVDRRRRLLTPAGGHRASRASVSR